jgi:hypothetical protein
MYKNGSHGGTVRLVERINLSDSFSELSLIPLHRNNRLVAKYIEFK